MRFATVSVILAISMLCAAMASAFTVQATCTAPVRLTLPIATQTAPMVVLVKSDDGSWQPAQYELHDGRISFYLQPAELGIGQIMLLINPPADLDIHDTNPPQLIGLKAGDNPLPARLSINLGALKQAPSTIRAGFYDAENKMDPTSVLVTLNGVRLPGARLKVDTPHPQRAIATVDLGQIEYGLHRLTISMADTAPTANTTQVTIDFERADTSNFLRSPMEEIEMLASSYYPNYEALNALNDGFKKLTGAGCGNDVSWASADNSSDHWLEVTMAQEQTVSEVTVYWAYSGGVYFTSQKILIQVPDDGGWRNVYSSPQEGHSVGPCTSFSFEPVKTNRFRIYQPAGGGSASRPNLMWLAEVEAR
jgi:hypothetical protein